MMRKTELRFGSDRFLATVFCLTSIILRLLVPMNLLFNGKYDDALMLNMSQELGSAPQGWSIMSMAKNIGYPVFLWASLKLRISPVLLSHLLYLASCSLLLLVLRSRVSRPIWIIMSAGLYLNPVLFGATASRVYRDVLTIAVVVAFSALTIMFLDQVGQSHARRQRAAFAAIALVGLSTVAFSVRNDVFWIISFFVLLTINSIKALWSRANRGRSFFIILTVFGGVVLSPTISNQASAKWNAHRFNVALPDDFYHGEFPELLKTWASVGNASPPQYVAVSRQQREIAYRVSETLRKIEPNIEGPDSDGWRSISCFATGGVVCSDIAGGYFPFAVREAIDSTFDPESELALQQVLRSARNELEVACGNGSISCSGKGLAVFLPRARDIEVISSVERFVDFIFLRTLRFGDRINLEAVGTVDGDSSQTVERWNFLIKNSTGLRQISLHGTPQLLRIPIEFGLFVFSIGMSAITFAGLLGLVISILKSRLSAQAGIAFSYWISSLLYILFISIVSANSFGPMIYDGVREMSYLVQPTAFVFVGSCIGCDLLVGEWRRSQFNRRFSSDREA
jgi:hypothetical protein